MALTGAVASGRVRGRSRALAAALLIVLALLPAGVRASTEAPLGVLTISTRHWVGENDLILQVLDPGGVAITDPAMEMEVRVVAPDGSARDAVPAALGRWATTGRDLWIARVRFDAPGTWTAVVRATLGDLALAGSTPVRVLPDDGTVPLGAPVPAPDTPTLVDVLNLTDAISSDPDQVAQFYVKSVADLVRDGQPFVLVLDTYLFRPNSACGGALGILHDIFVEYPSLPVVHAEPYLTRFSGGMLLLEPPEGPAQLAPWSLAYGIAEPPWVFVVAADGTLRAKMNGVFGTDELRAAMSAVSDWFPIGGIATPAPAAVG